VAAHQDFHTAAAEPTWTRQMSDRMAGTGGTCADVSVTYTVAGRRSRTCHCWRTDCCHEVCHHRQHSCSRLSYPLLNCWALFPAQPRSLHNQRLNYYCQHSTVMIPLLNTHTLPLLITWAKRRHHERHEMNNKPENPQSQAFNSSTSLTYTTVHVTGTPLI